MTAESKAPLVAVVMGSESDWDTMKRTHETLASFGVPMPAGCCRHTEPRNRWQ